MFDLDWKQILHDALANTVSGLIILAFASGALAAGGQWLLQGGVTLPGWLVGLLVGALLALGWAAWPRVARYFYLRPPIPEPPVVWEDLDVHIMQLFWLLSESSLELDFLDDAFKQHHRFEIHQAADRLVERGLLAESDSSRTAYQLTPDGRDHCVELNEQVRQLRELREAESRSRVEGDYKGPEGLTPDNLTALQRELLHRYVTAEGGRQLPGELALATGTNRIDVEHALEDLLAKGLLFDTHSRSLGTSYGLTPEGRTFLIEHGFTE